jgi:glutamate-1-semialdehyde 2,1-aminomutase
VRATVSKKVPLVESRILRAYAEKTPASAALYARALHVFPGGVTHAGRYLEPHPVFVSRAAGSRKWDVDGNEYVDYFGGHGALLLGHNHPAVMEAAAAQLARGTHFGASHELEVEWAELIQRLLPSAERVRFTNSGTEATLLALRAARAYTARPMVIRFNGHFHGWHDHAAAAAELPPGILKEIAAGILLCPPNDIEYVRNLCESRDDVAAAILEPTGATFGQIPLAPDFLRVLRELTARRGVVLIFDEVISGFRCSPGGAQGFYGVRPDLTTLAKIVAGGFPGAALVGRADILSSFAYGHAGERIQPPAIPHQGTFNGSPVSAAAGIAALRVISTTDIIARANAAAAAIRDGINSAARKLGVNWCAYGDFSAFHIFPNPGNEAISAADIQAGKVHWKKLKGATPLELIQKIRAGFLLHGVDVVGWPGGVVSGVHDGQDVDRTVSAFESVLQMLAEEGDLRRQSSRRDGSLAGA